MKKHGAMLGAWCVFLLMLVCCVSMAAPGAGDEIKDLRGEELVKAAQKEGMIVSYGMPDDWANLGQIWKTFTERYGLRHVDTDMGSQEELAKFKAEKDKPVADVGDIGIAFGPVGVKMGVLAKFKNSHWDEIPPYLKDPDGHWCATYQGTIAFIVNTRLVKNVPRTWDDLLKPEYKGMICMHDPRGAALGQCTVLAAAFAHGGDERNVEPGIAFFEKLVKAGNLKPVQADPGPYQKGEVPIGIQWDFNALSYRDTLGVPTEVVIPQPATLAMAYVAIINKYAPHPYAARLLNEFLFSDEAQIMYARGYARPIRNVQLPKDVTDKLPPPEAYANVKYVKDFDALEAATKKIAADWERRVLTAR